RTLKKVTVQLNLMVQKTRTLKKVTVQLNLMVQKNRILKKIVIRCQAVQIRKNRKQWKIYLYK
ncbi:hypothetical protein, partial [Aneurinibacillus migulanus]